MMVAGQFAQVAAAAKPVVASTAKKTVEVVRILVK